MTDAGFMVRVRVWVARLPSVRSQVGISIDLPWCRACPCRTIKGSYFTEGVCPAVTRVENRTDWGGHGMTAHKTFNRTRAFTGI